jgi:hypothetical protein
MSNGNLPAKVNVDKTTGEIDINNLGEIGISTAAMTALQEIRGTMLMARSFPRSYDEVWQRVIKACARKSLAEKAMYSFPRGGTTISGPSVHLARVAAQNYGNLRWGLDIIRNDEEQMVIRGWAWDVELNTKVTAEDSFAKLIYRKTGGWIKPDERDLRELINRRGAILIRNCLYNILPRDLIEDAVAICKKTLKSGITDPDGEKKRLILDFTTLGVTVGIINQYLGHEGWDSEDIVELKGVLLAITEGQAKIDDYFHIKQEEINNIGSLNLGDMSTGDTTSHQSVKGEDKKKIDK